MLVAMTSSIMLHIRYNCSEACQQFVKNRFKDISMESRPRPYCSFSFEHANPRIRNVLIENTYDVCQLDYLPK